MTSDSNQIIEEEESSSSDLGSNSIFKIVDTDLLSEKDQK